MNLLDLVIVLAAVGFGISGFRNGAVVGLCSLVGFFGGAIVGAQLAEPVGSAITSGRAQVPIAIFCVLLLAMLGQLGGVWVAGKVRARITRQGAQAVDSGVGSVLGVVSVLLVAWMVAVPLASSPYPSLAHAALHSRIVRAVNTLMPDDVRSVYSSMRSFLDQSGFPPVFGDLPSTPDVAVAAPDKSLPAAVRARVETASRSVVKIYGDAPSCDRGIEGSGFVYSSGRVITNAHVVAGTSRVNVVVGPDTQLPAKVVVYDPQRDVAVLAVPGLDLPALSFAPAPAAKGDSAVVMGYPEDGPLRAGAARIRSRSTVSGADIYGKGDVDREVYAVRGTVRSGNSGGPLLATNGTVLGIVFAAALDSSDTGYVLTAAEVAPDARTGRHTGASVGTGACTSG